VAAVPTRRRLLFKAGHFHRLDRRYPLQLVSHSLRVRRGLHCRRRLGRQFLGRLTRLGRRRQLLRLGRLLRCVGDSIGVSVGNGGGGDRVGGGGGGGGVGGLLAVAHAHLGGAHAGTAHVATPRVDRPRVVAHARRRVLGREVVLLLRLPTRRQGARIWLAFGTRLLQLLQVRVRVDRGHERARRLGVLLLRRQLLVADPLNNVRVDAVGHAVARRGVAGEAHVEARRGLRLSSARAVARRCAPLRGRVARAVLIAPLIRSTGHEALAHRLAVLPAVLPAVLLLGLLAILLALLRAGIRKAVSRGLRAGRLWRRRRLGRGADRIGVRNLLRVRLLLLLLVALAHARRALAPVGWPAPHVARGLPGPAVGLAPVVRDRLADALAPVGGDGVGAGDGLGQRRGRGLGHGEVVGGLEVLGAAMLVASLGHAHRRGALLARAGEARGRVRE